MSINFQFEAESYEVDLVRITEKELYRVSDSLQLDLERGTFKLNEEVVAIIINSLKKIDPLPLFYQAPHKDLCGLAPEEVVSKIEKLGSPFTTERRSRLEGWVRRGHWAYINHLYDYPQDVKFFDPDKPSAEDKKSIREITNVPKGKEEGVDLVKLLRESRIDIRGNTFPVEDISAVPYKHFEEEYEAKYTIAPHPALARFSPEDVARKIAALAHDRGYEIIEEVVKEYENDARNNRWDKLNSVYAAYLSCKQPKMIPHQGFSLPEAYEIGLVTKTNNEYMEIAGKGYARQFVKIGEAVTFKAESDWPAVYSFTINGVPFPFPAKLLVKAGMSFWFKPVYINSGLSLPRGFEWTEG